MGKKVKKKAQSGLKEKRVSASSRKDFYKENNCNSEIVDDGVVLGKERKVCSHFDEAIDLAEVSSKIESAESTVCEDCREGVIDSKNGKPKEKQGKKKSGFQATWICLHCFRFSCGGAGLPNHRQTHAVIHARQSRHPLVIQMENTNFLWCFGCNTRIQTHNLDDNGEQKDIFLHIVMLLKRLSLSATSIDMDGSNDTDLYEVRGLAILGNTCFFNSVMQNLLAIDMLRDYLLTFDAPMGPLASALKNIFVQTSPESELRNVVNLQPLFGYICAKASQFRGYQQQDSHELLRCLLDQLSTEDLRIKTFIDTTFGGKITSTVCCVECRHSSVVIESFLDLSLPLPAKKPPLKKALPAAQAKKTKLPPKRVTETSSSIVGDGNDNVDFVGRGDLLNVPKDYASLSIVSNCVQESLHLGNSFQAGTNIGFDPDAVESTDLPLSVESCLAHFVKMELLSGKHAWHCENCSKLQQEEHDSKEDEEHDDDNSNSIKVMRNATKRMVINKSPTILTIHLKRFAKERRGSLRKLKGHVVFKEFIDLGPYLDKRSALKNNCTYRLIGVVEHSGSMKGGHYVAYVKGGYRRKKSSEEENHGSRCNVWYYASDAHVNEITLEQVLRCEAYILFYEKVLL